MTDCGTAGSGMKQRPKPTIPEVSVQCWSQLRSARMLILMVVALACYVAAHALIPVRFIEPIMEKIKGGRSCRYLVWRE
jgi:hypothetical protein